MHQVGNFSWCNDLYQYLTEALKGGTFGGENALQKGNRKNPLIVGKQAVREGVF